MQRFGGALNLNVHFHALVPDGVFAGEPGKLAFHRVGRLTALDVDEVLAAIEALVDRRLGARGGSDDDGTARDPWVDEAPLLAGLAAASAQGMSAFAPRSGRGPVRVGQIGAAPQAARSAPDSCAARANGFSLHAGRRAGRATLIHIKSRMLLPRPPTEAELAGEEEDPREALVWRLIEHQRFKVAAELLHFTRRGAARSGRDRTPPWPAL